MRWRQPRSTLISHTPSRFTRSGTLILALGGWSCAPDGSPTEPSTEPAVATAAAATYTVRDLGTLGGPSSMALGISVFGHIVGWSETASGDRHAFVWKNGVMTDIGTLGGVSSEAYGINRAGVVVGNSRTASGERHAFRWRTGVCKDLGTLGTQSSGATAVNSAGQIVGWIGPPRDGAGEELEFASPFLYQSEVMTTFGSGTFLPTVRARAISPEGIIVGTAEDARAETADKTEDAWAWENGTGQRLPELAPRYAGAHGVNAAGDIVGYSSTSSGLNVHAVIWKRQ